MRGCQRHRRPGCRLPHQQQPVLHNVCRHASSNWSQSLKKTAFFAALGASLVAELTGAGIATSLLLTVVSDVGVTGVD